MKKHFQKWIAMALIAFISIGFAGCGTKKTDEAQTKVCFIYTDGLLDDLCAIEYLSGKYDSVVILPQNPEGLEGNDYGSKTVTDKNALIGAASKWFKNVSEYSASTDISAADLYLLGPLTEFAELLKDKPSLRSNRTLLMAGAFDGPDGAGEEWNAAADEEAYRYVIENMTALTQMTAPECEAEFSANGYPYQAEFLDEYKTQMESLNENVCCYDLQAVAFMFK